jgi:hypothetical protein
MAKVPNFAARANDCAVVYYGGGMHKKFRVLHEPQK